MVIGIPLGLETGHEESCEIMKSLKTYRERLSAIVPPQRPPVEPVKDLIKVTRSKTGPRKVYTDIDFLPPVLTWKEFQVVDSREGEPSQLLSRLTFLSVIVSDADIIFMANDFGDFSQLHPWQVVNQFPGEVCVTHKHRLLEVSLTRKISVCTKCFT